MPGGFVLVVGPSGAGKDTLIGLARRVLAAESRYHFPQRVITRTPSAHEDNVQIDDEAFRSGVAEGRFALSWHAHGLGYALPASAATAAARSIVVCNISRRAIAAARVTLPVVGVVEITAPPELLERRLAARGRLEDGDLAKRLARSSLVEADLVIVNSGSPEAGATALVDFLRTR